MDYEFPESSQLREIVDASHRKTVIAQAFTVSYLPPGGGYALHARPGWVAVPMESDFDEDHEVWIHELASRLQVDVMYVVLFERYTQRSEHERRAFTLDVSSTRIDPLAQELRSFQFMLFPPRLQCAWLRTVGDFMVMLGPRSEVEDFVGSTVEDAIEDFREEFTPVNGWPEPIGDAAAAAPWEQFEALRAGEEFRIQVSRG